jgi:hypothetical protein
MSDSPSRLASNEARNDRAARVRTSLSAAELYRRTCRAERVQAHVLAHRAALPHGITLWSSFRASDTSRPGSVVGCLDHMPWIPVDCR